MHFIHRFTQISGILQEIRQVLGHSNISKCILNFLTLGENR